MNAVNVKPVYSAFNVNKITWEQEPSSRPKPRRTQNSRTQQKHMTEVQLPPQHTDTAEKLVPRLGSVKANLIPRPPGTKSSQSQYCSIPNEHKNVIRSRARRRRDWEASPFLCVNTVSPDKVVIDKDTESSSADNNNETKRPSQPMQNECKMPVQNQLTKKRACTPQTSRFKSCTPQESQRRSHTPQRRKPCTPQTGQQRSRTPHSSQLHSRTPKLQSRCSSRTTPFGFYSFYTHKSSRSGRRHGGNHGNWMHQNPSFITGPPNLWSMGNKFWPSSGVPLERKQRVVPSATTIQSSSFSPNQQVQHPFKHADTAEPLPERFTAPDLELKIQTASAISLVSKSLAAERDAPVRKHQGRLLKARLKPLNAFTPSGPSVQQCAGVHPERKPQSPSQLQLQLRKQQLLDMLPPGIFDQRPETRESVHRTSVASNLSEDRKNDFDGLAYQDDGAWLESIPLDSNINDHNQSLMFDIPTDLEMEENLMQYMSIHSPNKKTLSKLLDGSANDSMACFSDVLIDGAAGMIDSALTKSRNRRKVTKDKVSFTTKKSILKPSKSTPEHIFSGIVWNGNKLERVPTAPDQGAQNFFDEETFDVDAERPVTTHDQPNILEAVAEKLLKEEECVGMQDNDVCNLSLEEKLGEKNDIPLVDTVLGDELCCANRTTIQVSMPCIENADSNDLDDLDFINNQESVRSQLENDSKVKIPLNHFNNVNSDYENLQETENPESSEKVNENHISKVSEFNNDSEFETQNERDVTAMCDRNTSRDKDEHFLVEGLSNLSVEDNNNTMLPEYLCKESLNNVHVGFEKNKKGKDEFKSPVGKIYGDSNYNSDNCKTNVEVAIRCGKKCFNDIEKPTKQKSVQFMVPETTVHNSEVVDDNMRDDLKDNVVNIPAGESTSLQWMFLTEDEFSNSKTTDIPINVELSADLCAKDYAVKESSMPSNTSTKEVVIDEDTNQNENVKEVNDGQVEEIDLCVNGSSEFSDANANKFVKQLLHEGDANTIEIDKEIEDKLDKEINSCVKGIELKDFSVPSGSNSSEIDKAKEDELDKEIDSYAKGMEVKETSMPSGANINEMDKEEEDDLDKEIDSCTKGMEMKKSSILSGAIICEIDKEKEDKLYKEIDSSVKGIEVKESSVPSGANTNEIDKEKEDELDKEIDSGANTNEIDKEKEEENEGEEDDDVSYIDRKDNNDDDRHDDTGSGSGGHKESQGPTEGKEPDQTGHDNNQRNTGKFDSNSQPNSGASERTTSRAVVNINSTSQIDIKQFVPSDIDFDYNDIPEVDESVLFCGICGLDEDMCVCPKLKDQIDQSLTRIDSGYSGCHAFHSNHNFTSEPMKECWTPREELQITDEASDLVMMYRNLYNAEMSCFNSESQAGKCVITETEEGTNPDKTVILNEDVPVISQDDPNTLSVVAKSIVSKTRSEVDDHTPVAPIPPVCFRINARPPPDHVYYFAYGENMNKNRVSLYIGRQEVQRLWGLLFGFQIKFNKKGSDKAAGLFANIESNPENSVEGCVYLITKAELNKLDKYTGCPQFFSRIMLPVWMINSNDPDALGVAQYCIPAVMYIAKDKWTTTDMTLTSEYSVQQCLRGSELLTPRYVQYITECARS